MNHAAKKASGKDVYFESRFAKKFDFVAGVLSAAARALIRAMGFVKKTNYTTISLLSSALLRLLPGVH